MDSGKSEEEHEVISKQIVDYYRKYSQNKQLPKYFSGTSLNYMPQIVKEDEIRTYTCPTIVVEDTNLLEKQLEVPISESEEMSEVKAASPTSSITSNKKLEWDNGADIGYNNYETKAKLYKSTSLPILVTAMHKKSDKISKPNLTSQIVTVISYSSHGDYTDEKQLYSSSSSPYEAEVPVESSSSGAQSNPKPLSSSSSSFVSTTAYLKNKIGYPDAESTPKVAFDINKVYNETPFIYKMEKVSKNKIISLCWTKPISVECSDHRRKKVIDKDIQTTITEALSKSVQTGSSLEIIPEDVQIVPEQPSNQSIIIMKHQSESDKSIYTTDDTAASSCNSFKYYKNGSDNKLQRNSFKSDLAVSTDSSKEIPVLGQLITKKQSNDLVKDVNRSIELLQKLLKSKKYDATTKKRYIKKIVAKIVDNKYSEDSTTSSELFIPKKQSNGTSQNKLFENVPWCPPQISKFTVKTFNQEFVPKESENDDKIFLEGTSNNLNNENAPAKKENVSSDSYQSWKENKTLSERLLEEKQKGQGDHLVKFALKERRHQLAWINDEISHLTKLKGLLENKVQKTTTVYMLSNIDLSDDPCSCSDPSRTSSRNYVIETELSGSTSSCGSAEYRYNDENGRKNYHVKELTCKKNADACRRIVTKNIEVTSDNKTTNIKVKTTNLGLQNESRFMVRPPPLVGVGKYETFPRSKTEDYRLGSSGISKPSRPHTNGLSSGKQYSFEIPLSSSSNVEEKINEMVNKYTRRISADRSVKQKCDCEEAELSKTEVPHDYDEIKTGTLDTRRYKEPEKSSSSKTTSSEKIATESSSDKSVHCKCGCTCRQTKMPEKRIVEDVYLDKGIHCKCGCTCVQESSSDKIIECRCKRINNATVDKSERTSQNGESRQYTVNIPLKKQETDSSSDKIAQCLCGCKCMEMFKKDMVNTNLQTDDCTCYNKEVQTSLKENSIQSGSHYSESSSASVYSSESETSTDFSGSVKSCLCCKQKNVTSKYLYSLRKKLSDQAYPLCRPCYRQNRKGNHAIGYYSTPGHVCNCYTVVKTTTLNEIKKTINDLNALDSQYCTCVDADNKKDSRYCDYCNCKLKKTSKNKNGIAYMLTFENESISEAIRKKKHKKKPYLEEIKIKIPVAYKKKHKDKENKRKKAKRSCDSDEISANEHRKRTTKTLQEYLHTNRPDFVEDAEERRKTVLDSRNEREEMSDEKKLLFMKKCQEYCERNAKRLFSEKEMKEITRRNYRKLPEVQQKLNTNRERQLRQANRLIADTFNKKLRENVLQGKRNIPTSKKVVDL